MLILQVFTTTSDPEVLSCKYLSEKGAETYFDDERRGILMPGSRLAGMRQERRWNKPKATRGPGLRRDGERGVCGCVLVHMHPPVLP